MHFFNLHDWNFWLDLSCSTLVESCLLSWSSCVRQHSAGLSMETLIADSRELLLASFTVYWTTAATASSSFSGCRSVNLRVSVVASMTWWGTGGPFAVAKSLLSESDGLSLMSSLFPALFKIATCPYFAASPKFFWGLDVSDVGEAKVAVDVQRQKLHQLFSVWIMFTILADS